MKSLAGWKLAGVFSLAALALAAGLASGGCYAFSQAARESAEQSAEMPDDSTAMHVYVDNRNSETVRVFAGHGSNQLWIGTVSSMTSQTLHIPGEPPGSGSLTFSVLAMNGRQWAATGVPSRAGSTVKLDIDGDLNMSSWTVLR